MEVEGDVLGIDAGEEEVDAAYGWGFERCDYYSVLSEILASVPASEEQT